MSEVHGPHHCAVPLQALPPGDGVLPGKRVGIVCAICLRLLLLFCGCLFLAMFLSFHFFETLLTQVFGIFGSVKRPGCLTPLCPIAGTSTECNSEYVVHVADIARTPSVDRAVELRHLHARCKQVGGSVVLPVHEGMRLRPVP